MARPFRATLEIIGINPFVRVPDAVLARLHREAGRDRGPIPVCGVLNGRPYRQRLVRYRGLWRLYVNMQMLDDSPRRIGETIRVTVAFDPEPRTVQPPAPFTEALAADAVARAAFAALSPSRRHEIVRYLAALKTDASRQRNIVKAMAFLRGEARFAGRDP